MQMPLVVNLQRKIKLDTIRLKEFTSLLSASFDEFAGKDFSVAFVSDRRMKKLNGFFRGKDLTTDVLSFPHEPDEFESASKTAAASSDSIRMDGSEYPSPSTRYLGDIVISAERAEQQAKENNLTLENEIKQLILHGLLHLCGYDHETDEGEMNEREVELRKQLGI
jgi:probable rRNA maturation factor